MPVLDLLPGLNLIEFLRPISYQVIPESWIGPKSQPPHAAGVEQDHCPREATGKAQLQIHLQQAEGEYDLRYQSRYRFLPFDGKQSVRGTMLDQVQPFQGTLSSRFGGEERIDG